MSINDIILINAVIANNNDLKAFTARHKAAFSDFATYLKKELIDEVITLQVSKEEAVITENIFNRLEGIAFAKFSAWSFEIATSERSKKNSLCACAVASGLMSNSSKG